MNIQFKAWHKREKKIYFRAYQKLLHVLLCEDDRGSNGGKGVPVKRASYEDCVLLQGTTITDKNGNEIFEGDCVRINTRNQSFEEVVEMVPDMFKSRKLHPLHFLLVKHGMNGKEEFEAEIIGNCYESEKDFNAVRSDHR